MEVVDIQEQQQQQDDEDFSKRVCAIAGGGGGGGVNHLRGWQHSSRIIRVARASGSKDRHSKVLTSKGLRDRRVRLSVSTAIQFYDLQDRLGFEQPSKAVEWLIEAASDAIAELPSLKNSFPDTPEQLMSDEKIMMNQMQNLSSTSETSKGSVGLSLSRSEILVNRAKARDRARERTAKDKEKEKGREHESHNVPSFTELLTVGIGNPNTANTTVTTTTISGHGTNAVEPGLFDKTTAMDYLASSGIIANNQINMISAAADSSNHNQDRLQHFSFVPENLNDYNLNFTISGFNRGTLQSNISPSLLPYFQRFPHLDGSNLPVVIGAASPAAPVQSENHHHHHHHQLTPALFDGGWQLCYAADGNHHSDQKGKGKN